MQLQEFGRVGEVFGGRHCIDLNLRRRFHVHGPVDLHRYRIRCRAPVRERRDFVAGLNLMHRGVIRRSVRPGAADDPDVGSWCGDARDSCRNLAAPAGRGDEETGRLGSGRPPAGRRENVRPHVEHRQEVISPVRVWRGDDLRFLGEVQPRDRIERVEVDPHDHLQVCWWVLRNVHEHVHRAFAKLLSGFDVRGLLARDVHRQQRIEVEISLDSDGSGLLLRELIAGLGLRWHERREDCERAG